MSARLPSTYWFTGLSGAGKTTLCNRFVDHERSLGRPIIMLDGDDLREVMAATSAHCRGERLQLAMRYAHLCRLLTSQGVNVAIATISLFKEVHRWNRENLCGYTEIYIDVPLAELQRRDPKGIYLRAAAGTLANVAGLDLVVDVPESPDVHLRWREQWSIDDAFDELLKKLSTHDSPLQEKKP